MQNSENVLVLGSHRHNSACQHLTRVTEVYKQGSGGNKQIRPEGSCLMRLSCGCSAATKILKTFTKGSAWENMIVP